MSLQWTLIAGFLYVEVAIVLLLVLPVASPQRWNKIFKSRFMKALEQQASWYFAIVLFILILFLLDAVREMRKYSNAEHHDHAHSHNTEMQVNMRLFRAQRNFYISGFALFLSFVLRRLVILITKQATLMAEHEASLRQAQSATSAAQTYLKKGGSGDEESTKEKKDDDEVEELKKKFNELQSKYTTLEKDREALKSQADSVSKEYDRLMKEHEVLQKKLETSEDKKDL